MPDKLLRISNFNRRLWVAGGRDQTPEGAMRKSQNGAPELTTSIRSRYGSTLLYNIVATALTVFEGVPYQYDGNALYKAGASIATGFNGGVATFAKMPPNIGLQDYLFVAGGGKMVKVDPSGTVTNWGINGPGDQGDAMNLANDQIVIDSFVNTAAQWTPNANCTISNSTESQVGGGSLKVNPSASPWRIQQTALSPTPGAILNLGNYPNHDISLPTDVIQIWVMFDKEITGTNGQPNATWLQVEFDVEDGTFKHNVYRYAWGLVPSGSTKPIVKHNVQQTVGFSAGQWQLLTAAKSAFFRVGNGLQKDWTNIQALRISGGNFAGNLFLDDFLQMGGSPLGAGPAVGNGGSSYEYYVTFQNLVTGNESHPQQVSIKVSDTQVNNVKLTNIPTTPGPGIAADSQVGARRLYRTTAENAGFGQSAFYFDTIYDNSTTTYTDRFADSTQPVTLTPWQASVAVPPNGAADYYIDAGNGYYFKLTTAGTTGSQPPQWKIPTSVWSAQSARTVGETIAPLSAGGVWFQVTALTGAGVSGIVQPNWATLAPTFTDGQVTWTNIGLQTTNDNGVIWTFQGINSSPFLDSNQVLNFDNQYPLSTYNDAVGPYQGTMFWCRDSTPGNKGKVYFSPPGKPESVLGFVQVSSDDEPTQKLVIWDERLWVITTRRVYPIIPLPQPDSSVVWSAGPPVQGARGTSQPFSVVSTTRGIVYQASDGIRLMNNGDNGLVAFDPVAPLFRGQSAETLFPFVATVAAETRGEILFSNALGVTHFPNIGIYSLGLIIGQETPAWRQIALEFFALYYDQPGDTIYASISFGAAVPAVYAFEASNVFQDGENAVKIDWQTPSVLTDAGQFGLIKRIYLDINCNGNALTPKLYLDETQTAISLPDIINTQRGIIEIDFQRSSKFFGFEITGPTTSRVELFEVSAEIAVSSLGGNQ